MAAQSGAAGRQGRENESRQARGVLGAVARRREVGDALYLDGAIESALRYAKEGEALQGERPLYGEYHGQATAGV